MPWSVPHAAAYLFCKTRSESAGVPWHETESPPHTQVPCGRDGRMRGAAKEKRWRSSAAVLCAGRGGAVTGGAEAAPQREAGEEGRGEQQGERARVEGRPGADLRRFGEDERGEHKGGQQAEGERSGGDGGGQQREAQQTHAQLAAADGGGDGGRAAADREHQQEQQASVVLHD